jgi:hypothetical protein
MRQSYGLRRIIFQICLILILAKYGHILGSLMGTVHGAQALGLWPRGHACRAGARGRVSGFCLGDGHRWGNPNNKRPAKIFGEAHNFVP